MQGEAPPPPAKGKMGKGGEGAAAVDKGARQKGKGGAKGGKDAGAASKGRPKVTPPVCTPDRTRRKEALCMGPDRTGRGFPDEPPELESRNSHYMACIDEP